MRNDLIQEGWGRLGREKESREERDMNERLVGGVFVRELCLKMEKTERLTNLFLPIIWVNTNPKEISKNGFHYGRKENYKQDETIVPDQGILA